MFVRPPQQTKPADKDPLTAALEQEVLNEKASTLFRLTKKLENALSSLEESKTDFNLSEDEKLNRLAQAGEALWHVIIQRELCGLRQHKAFNDHLKVPTAVRLRMGPASCFRLVEKTPKS
ncbi:MAG: hypothetical protein K5905_14815 [Roseibium sp.]|uniref:DUF6665 family protein n=1 Tax=Roseibium sp. TaxID=1936156 RepID=UPI00260D272D|nr:DUF6665 family protein [Roseibium sp.]MCV0426732.1 hypothetical protein [Roseibium sp.]